MNPEKNLIFSLDSIINVEILDIYKKELLTNIILYPHFNISVNPEKNNIINK
jgi:hypothetical protein